MNYKLIIHLCRVSILFVKQNITLSSIYLRKLSSSLILSFSLKRHQQQTSSLKTIALIRVKSISNPYNRQIYVVFSRFGALAYTLMRFYMYNLNSINQFNNFIDKKNTRYSEIANSTQTNNEEINAYFLQILMN